MLKVQPCHSHPHYPSIAVQGAAQPQLHLSVSQGRVCLQKTQTTNMSFLLQVIPHVLGMTLEVPHRDLLSKVRSQRPRILCLYLVVDPIYGPSSRPFCVCVLPRNLSNTFLRRFQKSQKPSSKDRCLSLSQLRLQG